MNQPVGTEPKAQELARLLGPCLPEGHTVVLFGSRALGIARPCSDWDLGILGPRPLPSSVMQGLRDRLESYPTLHTIEIVDLEAVPAAFKTEALRGAVEIARS